MILCLAPAIVYTDVGIQGIVTRFLLKAHPQGQVWVRETQIYFSVLGFYYLHMQGGVILYASPAINTVLDACLAFESNVADPKASILCSVLYTNGLVRSFHYTCKLYILIVSIIATVKLDPVL